MKVDKNKIQECREHLDRCSHEQPRLKLMYEWVGAGYINFVEYELLIDDMLSERWNDGFDAGYNEGV